MNSERWGAYRTLLRESMQSAVDELDFSHAALLQQQMTLPKAEANLLPALVCLRISERLAGDPHAAIAPATSLALLIETASVFATLDAPEDASQLSRSWGLPRSLNAGDALFAMGHKVLLSADEVPAERRLAATRVLDEGSRAFVEAVLPALEEDDRGMSAGCSALYPAAVRLAVLFSGSDVAEERLAELVGRLRDRGGVGDVIAEVEGFRL